MFGGQTIDKIVKGTKIMKKKCKNYDVITEELFSLGTGKMETFKRDVCNATGKCTSCTCEGELKKCDLNPGKDEQNTNIKIDYNAVCQSIVDDAILKMLAAACPDVATANIFRKLCAIFVRNGVRVEVAVKIIVEMMDVFKKGEE